MLICYWNLEFYCKVFVIYLLLLGLKCLDEWITFDLIWCTSVRATWWFFLIELFVLLCFFLCFLLWNYWWCLWWKSYWLWIIVLCVVLLLWDVLINNLWWVLGRNITVVRFRVRCFLICLCLLFLFVFYLWWNCLYWCLFFVI